MFRYFFSGILMLILLSGCDTSQTQDVDISNIKAEIKISRMEKELFGIPKGNLLSSIPKLRTNFPGFFDLFCERILRIPIQNDTVLSLTLEDFLQNAEMKEVHAEVEKKFSNISDIETQINDGFKHYKYYFPKKNIPQLVSFISGFNYSIVCSDSVSGIGLDMYLGKDCDFYTRLNYPKYKSIKMSREFIPADVMKAWAQTEFEPAEPATNFLSKMIFFGKVQYFLDAVLPAVHDSLKIGFTGSQLEFCKKNEKKIWSVLIDKNLLFSSKTKEYEKFLNEGPTTNGFPNESPSQIGIWVGWQIVRKFMSENKTVTLAQLMKENDAQKILQQSHYKP